MPERRIVSAEPSGIRTFNVSPSVTLVTVAVAAVVEPAGAQLGAQPGTSIAAPTSGNAKRRLGANRRRRAGNGSAGAIERNRSTS